MLEEMATKRFGYSLQSLDTEREERPSTSSYKPPSTSSYRPSTGMRNVPVIEINNNIDSIDREWEENSKQNYESQSQSPVQANSDTIKLNIHDPSETFPLSPELTEIIDSMKVNTTASSKSLIGKERRNAMCNDVAKQAYMRCLNAVEKSAMDDEYVRNQKDKLIEQWKNKERLKKETSSLQLLQLQNSLDMQIEEHNVRKQREIDDRNNAHACFPGFKDPEKTSHATKKKILEDLRKQINSKQEKYDTFKRNQLDQENLFLETEAMEIEIQNITKRAEHLEKQRDLLEAWERESHIRNLKTLQATKGIDAVVDYMDEAKLKSRAVTASGNLSQSNLAIGFDSRKSRK
jgi:hypothetical protein